MGMLKAVEDRGWRDGQRREPHWVAVDVAADAMLDRPPRGTCWTEEQVSALQGAAEYALVTVCSLEAEVHGEGDCHGQDPEHWFPVYQEEPARGENRATEQEEARQLCGACPVRAQCLALDFAYADGHVQQLWGIWGGLGARDRRELMPLWLELRRRLLSAAHSGTAASSTRPPVPTTVSPPAAVDSPAAERVVA